MIGLPKDAEGREIPLDTKTLYDDNGALRKVTKFIVYPYKNVGWSVCLENGFDDEVHDPDLLHLTQPDSWKKLIEDLSEAGDARYQEACAYFHRDKDEGGCTSCPGGEDGCTRIAMRDIADRIRKLRGED